MQDIPMLQLDSIGGFRSVIVSMLSMSAISGVTGVKAEVLGPCDWYKLGGATYFVFSGRVILAGHQTTQLSD